MVEGGTSLPLVVSVWGWSPCILSERLSVKGAAGLFHLEKMMRNNFKKNIMAILICHNINDSRVWENREVPNGKEV